MPGRQLEQLVLLFTPYQDKYVNREVTANNTCKFVMKEINLYHQSMGIPE